MNTPRCQLYFVMRPTLFRDVWNLYGRSGRNFWHTLMISSFLVLIFRNACTKSGSLRFSQFSGCWLILSVYIIMSFDFPFVRLFGVRSFCYYLYLHHPSLRHGPDKVSPLSTGHIWMTWASILHLLVRSHYGSKVPAVTVTVFKYRNKIGKIVVKAVPHSVT
jgi:hypothetical protein